MRLFLAEKPSVGRELSKYLPGAKKNADGYIICGDDVVTWAFGHVLEQAEPQDYDEKFGRWSIESLPIVPKEWQLNIKESSAKQFHTIRHLLEKADSVVHTGDPDREGQLLIDEILEYCHYDKPVQRILVNALDEKSMKDALQDLRNNADFFNLRQSALGRARADWLMGMNLTRLYTVLAQRRGHRETQIIGRVKTPTLALVVRREEELQAFTPVTYYTIDGIYTHENGEIVAQWKPQDIQRGLDPENRLLDKAVAEELVASLKANPTATITDREKKKKKELQRLPLSLSALQVIAGKAYGYDPQQVLDTVQSLYEKKYTTYPRSDCEYLPTSQYKDAGAILENLKKSGQEQLVKWAEGTDISIKSRAWDDSKITAHHAIIPTTVFCNLEKLAEREQRIYSIIAQAYMAQFYPVHEYEQTKITIDHNGETFVANGKVVTVIGWKALYQKNNEDGSKDTLLPQVAKNDSIVAKDFEIKEKETKPPSRFTSATLLQAMKEIHKYVKNDDVKKQLKDVSGIGTEATRASIINELITKKFLNETGKKKILTPTEKGIHLIHSLPDDLSYPDKTAVWEERLAQMSAGEVTLQSFLDDQVQFINDLIAKGVSEMPAPSELNGTPCPSCKKGILQERNGKNGAFRGCSCYPTCTYTENLDGTTSKKAGGTRNTSVKREAIPISSLTEEQKKYGCPICRRAYLLPEGRQWVCSRGDDCNTVCADFNGQPVNYVDPKTGDQYIAGVKKGQ